MQLSDYKEQFSGRAWLVGTGPSLGKLTQAQADKLNQEFMFTGSRFFFWKDAPISPDFYVMTEQAESGTWLDKKWYQKAKARIARFWVTWQPAPEGWVPLPRPPSPAHDVLNWGMGGLMGTCMRNPDFGVHLHAGKITPVACAQVAQYMGFSKLYTIGVDGTRIGDVYDVKRPRTDHAPGIERQYMAAAAKAVSIIDCTPDGQMAKERGGPLTYQDLDEVLDEVG